MTLNASASQITVNVNSDHWWDTKEPLVTHWRVNAIITENCWSHIKVEKCNKLWLANTGDRALFLDFTVTCRKSLPKQELDFWAISPLKEALGLVWLMEGEQKCHMTSRLRWTINSCAVTIIISLPTLPLMPLCWRQWHRNTDQTWIPESPLEGKQPRRVEYPPCTQDGWETKLYLLNHWYFRLICYHS